MEEKTNKRQVHPYKSVSWPPTHQGILEIRDFSIGQNVKVHVYTYIPRWLVPRNLDEAYNGVCVESGAQYKKNGLCILA